MSVFNYLVSRARNITRAGNPAERSKDANGGEPGEVKPTPLMWGDFSSSFPLHHLHLRSSQETPSSPSLGTWQRHPLPMTHECSLWETLKSSILVERNPSGALPKLHCPPFCVILNTERYLVAIQLVNGLIRLTWYV